MTVDEAKEKLKYVTDCLRNAQQIAPSIHRTLDELIGLCKDDQLEMMKENRGRKTKDQQSTFRTSENPRTIRQ